MPNMKRHRRRVLGAALAVLCLATSLAACGSDDGDSGESGGSMSLRTIKTTPNLTQLPLLYALEGGLFEDEGLKLDEAPDATTSTAPIQALLAGQADVVMIGSNAILSGIGARQDLVAVGLFAPATGFQVVLSKKVVDKLSGEGITAASPIEERVQALRGLTIASNGPGNAVDSILRATLNEYGVKPDGDVTLRAIPDPPAMAAAFREGQVDGFIFGLPFTTQPVVDGLGTVWVNYIAGDVPSLSDAPSGLVVTTKAYAKSHEAELVAFNAALTKAYAALKSDPDKVKPTLEAAYFAETPKPLFDAAFPQALPIFDNGPIATEAGYGQMLDIYNSDESVKQKVDAKFADVFDISFAEKAAGK